MFHRHGLDLSLIAWDDRTHQHLAQRPDRPAEDKGKVEVLLDVVRQEKVANEPPSCCHRSVSPDRNTPSSLQILRIQRLGANTLKTKLGELQRRSDTLTKQIAALDTDIGRASSIACSARSWKNGAMTFAIERDQIRVRVDEIKHHQASKVS